MTQKEFDEKQSRAIVIPPGERSNLDRVGSDRLGKFDVWFWHPLSQILEHRTETLWARFERPLSQIESEGRTIEVKFKTDLPTKEFLMLLYTNLRVSLDQLGFAGIDDPGQSPESSL